MRDENCCRGYVGDACGTEVRAGMAFVPIANVVSSSLRSSSNLTLLTMGLTISISAEYQSDPWNRTRMGIPTVGVWISCMSSYLVGAG